MLIDGAEICELVGSYILSFLGKVCGIQSVGFCRDDVLACLHKISVPASDKIRKDMIRTFRENFGLNIFNKISQHNYRNKFKNN